MRMPKPLLSDAHMLSSIAGEEDPGASLDMVRNLIAQEKHRGRNPAARTSQQSPQIHIDCAEGGKHIAVDVSWHPGSTNGTGTQPSLHTPANLLGLVVAHHGAIANTAWSCFNSTGQRHIALEVDEDQDGVFYVSLKDA